MKRLLAILLMLITSSELFGALPLPRAREEASQRGRKTTRRAVSKQPAKRAPHIKVSAAMQRYYEGKRLRRYSHFLRIFTNPKSNASTKARAARQLIRIGKTIKTPAYTKYIATQLKRHKLTPASLQKAAKVGGSYLEFNKLANRYAKRKARKKLPGPLPIERTAAQRVKTIYDKELTGPQKQAASQILKAKGLSIDEFRAAATPPAKVTRAKPTPAGPVAATPTPSGGTPLGGTNA